MNDYELISKLRFSIGDIKEPYLFSDEQLNHYIEQASLFYSKYRPAKKMGQIQVFPNEHNYSLPEDYQMWISGLENYTILGNTLFIENNISSFCIDYFYYADRKPSEIPACDIPILLDYCISEIIENTVICKSNQQSSDSSITALKLGKGLDITFDTLQDLKKELYSIAEKKKEKFLEELKSTVSGGWY